MSFPRQAAFFSQREMKQSLYAPHFTHTALFALQTSNFTLHTSHFSLLAASFTLQTSHFTLRSSHSKLKLHTPHFPLLPSHFTLLSSRPTLHTALNLRTTKITLVPKWRKSVNKSISQPLCSHSKTIYEIQLQKTIVLRMQPHSTKQP